MQKYRHSGHGDGNGIADIQKSRKLLLQVQRNSNANVISQNTLCYQKHKQGRFFKPPFHGYCTEYKSSSQYASWAQPWRASTVLPWATAGSVWADLQILQEKLEIWTDR